MFKLLWPLFFLPALALAESVPKSNIELNGAIQESVLGSFCWHINQGGHFCLDNGLTSPKEPLTAPQNFSLELKLPDQDKLRKVQYSFVPVDYEMIVDDGTALNGYGWNTGMKALQELDLNEKLTISSNLKPGLYVLGVLAWWKNHNDAYHGFLIKISP
ncbi:hypothetical protein [Arenicella xantha]|uniref:Uncharacterized protein n=1 Tax=Arenicella xantha TaxID=644221 RepID=A0A395JEE8_9GAMM|nr:hypothetical protein [Arenicella xantha]RBP44837.1 hypothetical protein DFR28_1212 [Arenicella xantha]